MAKGFNIFGKISEEIDDFDNGGIWIVGKPDNKYENPQKRGERGGYYHSQRQLLDAIDMMGASKFRKGIWDDEGQRKTYLNIANFYRDVMKMKIMIYVSNYIFQPKSLDFTWVVWSFSRIFKTFAQRENYDDQIGEFAHDLSTYGTCVSIKATKWTERVPLRTIRNTQSAKTLYEAAVNGGYVILDSEKHYNEMELMPDWDVESLDNSKTYQVIQRYGLVPEGLVKGWYKMTDLEVSRYMKKDEEKMVLAIAITIPEGAGNVGKGEHLCFLEELDEDSWPLDECHIEQADGRWIGKGEMEKQLENQIARNLNANFRRRGILWAAKKIFQSTDDEIQSNLVYEVLDGEVIHVKNNGTISQVNTANQHSSEITADDTAVIQNSQQNAFAFEVATGEALPSGTPFRLGVVLANAVDSHFKSVRKTFSNFLIRAFFNQLVEICEEEYSGPHNIQVPLGETDLDAFREDLITYHTNLRIWDYILRHKAGQQGPDRAAIRLGVEQELARNEYAFLDAPKAFYKDADFYMTLNLVDDIGADIADLTTLYGTMVQKGDPRAENVLKQIFALRGKALAPLIGPTPEPAAQPTQTPPEAAPATPQLPAAVSNAVAAVPGPTA